MATTAGMAAYLLPGVPVHQPPHLEGNPSLATEILPGPPSLVSAQQSVHKRDPKKPSTIYSYLPHSDPGSTYSGIMHGTLIGQEPIGARNKRSRVDKGTAAGRAQRASARSQNGASAIANLSTANEAGSSSMAQHAVDDSDTYTMVVDDEPSVARTSSSLSALEAPTTSTSGRLKKRDKGKGKETDVSPIRVKEEPKSVSLHSPDSGVNLLNNEDHCSSCRSQGALVYCDGCPRAFHLWCLDPPMEGVDEGDSRWFCPSCVIRKSPPKKPLPSLLSPLNYQLHTSIPVEYQLPDDIRSFFKDVTAGPKGTYVDGSELKPPRLNRHGQLEDRDPHRLKDRNGAPVLCFKCGMSALPGDLAAAAPAAKRARRSTSKVTNTWKSIVSCDYCNLHWHLDCVDPPLSTMPPYNKKWMCPNHSEQVIPPKRRIPKQNAPSIEITKPRQFNNGNIEIIRPESTPITHVPRVAVDEVLINGRRYRVPERVLILDFWAKLNQNEQGNRDSELMSNISSPLTSLSSLEDLDDRLPPDSVQQQLSEADAAQVLCNLRSIQHRVPALPNNRMPPAGSEMKRIDSGVQTDLIPVFQTPQKPLRPRGRPKGSTNVNRLARTLTAVSNDSTTATTPAASSISSTVKRKKAVHSVQPQINTRELRSRSRNTNHESSLTSISSLGSLSRTDEPIQSSSVLAIGTPPIPTSVSEKSKPFAVKIEETDYADVILNGFVEAGSSSPSKVTSRRTRVVRHSTQKETDSAESKEKRGKKRKERDEDFAEADVAETNGRTFQKNGQGENKDKQVLKLPRTPEGHRTPRSKPAAAPVAAAISSTPSTPSLKIRLPRLSNLNVQSFVNSNANGEAASTSIP